MKALLKIECIGDDVWQTLNFWKKVTMEICDRGIADSVFGSSHLPYFVAEIIGFCPTYNYKRIFLHGRKDYSQANSVGSRGVFAFYELMPDKIYDIKSPVSWGKTDRYFCTITTNGDIIKLTKKEVDEWLKSQLE